LVPTTGVKTKQKCNCETLGRKTIIAFDPSHGHIGSHVLLDIMHTGNSIAFCFKDEIANRVGISLYRNDHLILLEFSRQFDDLPSILPLKILANNCECHISTFMQVNDL